MGKNARREPGISDNGGFGAEDSRVFQQAEMVATSNNHFQIIVLKRINEIVVDVTATDETVPGSEL